AEDIRQRLLRVPNVNKVDIIGEQPEKIFIELSHAKLATLGITPQQIFDNVARQNAVTSGGSVDTSADRINLRVTGAFSGVEALGIVLLVSFLSLGWRAGIVVALSVPLVLSIVLTVMYAAGIDLHRITLGALIIALGLLVDDAIIAIEMMVVKMEQGWDRARAATFAWTSTAFPMLTGTLVTAAGFLPVGFAKSSAGEYAGGIFWIVGLALVASWIVAVLFTPYLGLKLLPDLAKPGAHKNPNAIYETRIYRALRSVIEFALRRRVAVVAMTAG